jgi:hypothetical protein
MHPATLIAVISTLVQGSKALFFDSAISDISQYRIGLSWEDAIALYTAIVPGENVKYRIYRIIGAVVGLSGFAGIPPSPFSLARDC